MAKIDNVQEVAVADLVPYAHNAKQHSDKQIDLIARSIQEFGFLNPILVDHDGNIIAGHGRALAAHRLGLKTVPVIHVEGLTEEQFKAYVLADNKLTELGTWDMSLVEEEIQALREADFDITLTGFEFAEPTEHEEGAEGSSRKDLSGEIKSTYEVIIECNNEEEQEEIYNSLTEGGYTCRVLTL